MSLLPPSLPPSRAENRFHLTKATAGEKRKRKKRRGQRSGEPKREKNKRREEKEKEKAKNEKRRKENRRNRGNETRVEKYYQGIYDLLMNEILRGKLIKQEKRIHFLPFKSCMREKRLKCFK